MTKNLNVSWVGGKKETATLQVRLEDFTPEDAVWVLRDMFNTAINELNLPDNYYIRVKKSPKVPECPQTRDMGPPSSDKMLGVR